MGPGSSQPKFLQELPHEMTGLGARSLINLLVRRWRTQNVAPVSKKDEKAIWAAANPVHEARGNDRGGL